MKKHYTCLMLMLLPAAIVFAAEKEPNGNGVTNEVADAAYEELELLGEAIMHIRRHYVEEVTFSEIFDGALKGMFSNLDPHSAFLDEDALREMEDDTKGHFGGIGIQIGFRDGMLSVIAPMEGTPAFRAGLAAGDRIIEIDGEKTLNMSLRDAVNLLRGPKGTEVTVRLMRQGRDESWEVTIVRDVIDVASVKGARIIRPGVGYVRLTQFSQPTGRDLKEALLELEKEGMTALVLDLRNNAGGLLRSAVEVAQLFLPRNALIVTTRGRKGVFDGTESRSYGELNRTWPMVVLVNKGSASASEIVAGALKDNNRAVLLGETTFGKGSVQSVIRMRERENTAIRLTTAYYYTPSGKLIHDQGIKPDITVEVPIDEWVKVVQQRAREENPTLFEHLPPEETLIRDEQLERALDLLEAVLIFQNMQ